MSIGGFISGIFGSKNKNHAKGYDVDEGAYEYGGHKGGAQEAAGRYAARADDWQNKANEYGAQQQDLYNRGNVGMDQSQQARGMQMDAASMARARATGATPSIAQMQADRQMGQAAAAQTSAAASARGPGALALAQQNAAANTANAQSNISGQAQINAANERMQAEQSYANQAAGIRGGDVQGAQTAYGASGQMGQLGLGAGQMGLGYTQAEMGVNQAQLAAHQNKEGQKSSNAIQTQQTNAAIDAQNAQTNQANAMGLMGAAAGAAGKMASDERVKDVGDTGGSGAGDIVAATFGTAKPTDAQVEAARGAIATANEPTPKLSDPTLEDRQNNAGGGYMLGKQLGTALYGGRPDGSIPLSVQAGMKSTGVEPKGEAKKDAAKSGEAAKATGEKKPSVGDKLSAGLSDTGGELMKSSRSTDTSFHGPHGYTAPQLLSVMTSDGDAKEWDFQKKYQSAGSGPSEASFEVMKGGGEDVGSTMKKMSDWDTQFQQNAGGHMYTSDERTKEPGGVLGLDDPNLRVGEDGRGYIAKDEPQDMDAGQRFAASKKAKAGPGDIVAGMMKKGGSSSKKMSDEELLKRAREMLGGIQTQKEAQLANGPSVSTGDRPGNNAARALASAPYTYKPGATPPEQAPREPNYGPMAQNMAKDPVARTAVIEQPNGMLAIDIPKYTKVLGAAAADNQAQDDEQDKKISMLAQMVGRRG